MSKEPPEWWATRIEIPCWLLAYLCLGLLFCAVILTANFQVIANG